MVQYLHKITVGCSIEIQEASVKKSLIALPIILFISLLLLNGCKPAKYAKTNSAINSSFSKPPLIATTVPATTAPPIPTPVASFPVYPTADVIEFGSDISDRGVSLSKSMYIFNGWIYFCKKDSVTNTYNVVRTTLDGKQNEIVYVGSDKEIKSVF